MRISCFITALLLTALLCCHAVAADSPQLTAKEKAEGFVSIFDGKTLDGWHNTEKGGYAVENGVIYCTPKNRGKLFTKKEYDNFVLRLDIKLYPGCNNGVGLRASMQGTTAYTGMESQILDDSAPKHKNLKPYQYHGSIYGIFPAKRGSLKPMGEWNQQEIICDGSKIKITLNGKVIVEGDLDDVRDGTPDGKEHPGRFRKSGFVGLLGYGVRVDFRNIRIKELPDRK